MELRKHPKLELGPKRPLFFGIGLVLALSFVMAAFEFKVQDQSEKIDTDDMTRNMTDIMNDPVVLPPEPRPQPPAPKREPVTTPRPSTNIEIVSDDLPEELVEPVTIDQLEAPDDMPVVDLPEEGIPNEIVPYAEKMPTFKGGDKAFLEYLGKNTRYTRLAKSMGIEGQIVVSFVVERDGSLTDIKVVKGLGAGLDEEAIRVLAKSPKWEPGRQGGHDVRVRMMVPIRFRLK